MTTLTTPFPARTPVSLILSVVLHGSVIAGILYASLHQSRELPAAPQPIAITMVAPEVQPEPAPAVVAPAPQPEPEPEPQAVPEPPKAEPVPIAKPEPKPKPRPKPKPKPKIEKKPDPAPRKTAPDRADPFKQERAATQPRPATAPKAATATATAPVNATGPKALSISKPAYPARAAALRIEGNVRVKFDVDSDGRVGNVTILSAQPRNMFERSVKDQVKKWRYQPGQPGQGITMNIVFRINGGAKIE